MSALGAAYDVVYADVPNPAPGADSYYDISLDAIGKAPDWATPERFVRQLGRLKFYNVDRDHEAAELVAAGGVSPEFRAELAAFLA